MKRILPLLVFVVSLFAQPSITPTNITVTVGTTQNFTLPGAKKPYWVISGAGSINAQTGDYTAPLVLPANTTVIIHVQDFSPPYSSAIATFTLMAKLIPLSPCSCKDGKDGASAGDIFILSDRPVASLTFTRSADGTWTAPMQIAGSFFVFVQVYRNDVRVAEKDVVSLVVENGRLKLATRDMWAPVDVVIAKFVRQP